MENPLLAIIIPSVYGGIFLIFILYACGVYLTEGPPADEGNAQPGQPPAEVNAQQGQPLEEMNAQQGQPPEEGNAAQPRQPPEEGNAAQPGGAPEEGNAAQPGQPPEQPQDAGVGGAEPEIILTSATVSFNIFQAIFIVPSIKLIPKVSTVLVSDAYLIFALPFTILDALFLYTIWKQKGKISPRLVAVIEIGYVREILEVGLWALGLYIQNIIEPECIICLFTLVNCSYFLISFVLFLRHPRALSFLDFAIGINAVVLVHFIKLIDSGRKLKGYEYGLFSVSITTCVSVLLFKSHQESVIGGIENPRTIFSILGICIFTPIRRFLEYCWNMVKLARNWLIINYPVAKNYVKIRLEAAWNCVCNWVCNVAPNWVCNVAPNWLAIKFNAAWTRTVTQYNACLHTGSGDGAAAV